MSRRQIVVTLSLLLLFAGAIGGALLWGLQQVPTFYEEALAEQPSLEVRKEAAMEFVQRTVNLAEDIKQSDDWSEEFTQRQVNAWLAEELETKYAEIVPAGVSDPRVKFVDESILIGFRYSDDKYTGVVSLRLKPSVVGPNRVAIEIQSIRAGAIPVPLDQILESLSDDIYSEGWRIESRQANGNDVLVLHLDPDEGNQPVLEAIKIIEGKLQVAGTRRTHSSHSGDDAQQHPRLANQSSAKKKVQR